MNKLLIIGLVILTLLGVASYLDTKRVCGNVANYDACDLSLQAWGNETKAVAAGNGVY
jgi:hypothetical protein